MPTPSKVEKTTALLQSSMRLWFRKIQATHEPTVASGLEVLASAATFEVSASLLYGFFDKQAMHAVKVSDELLGKLWPLLAYYSLDMIDWESLTEWVLTEHRSQEFSDPTEIISGQ